MGTYAEVVFNIPVNTPFTYSIPKDTPCERGCRVSAYLGKRKLTGLVVSVGPERTAGDFEVRELLRVIDTEPVVNDEIIDLARWMSHTYLCSLGEALHTMIPSGRKERDSDDALADNNRQLRRDFSLAEQQTEAIGTILRARKRIHYLQGVTGSGKTEIFLQVAKRLHQEGRGVIYLVPEISLVHQVVEVFASEFREAVAVLHSGLTASQRLREWRRLMRGEVRIAIGARSAVFAPVSDLGLIIIDEEHEGTYKSGFAPRYHARQVASYRCRARGATLVLGSATPSMEAYFGIETGRLSGIHLPERMSGGSLPEIEVVDMRREKGLLSRRLLEAIRQVKTEGRQTILFLNRRGFAYLFHCRSCGFEMKCRDCSVSMTYHRNKNQMICHYCGYRRNPLKVCPECGSLDIGFSGFGTERIEEEMAAVFPEISISRIDTDSVKKRKDLQDTLMAFRRGEIDVLLGTQMVAKGLNFPGVKLVGIVSADVGLQMPDFRAPEKVFSLIVQVAGRAGRTTTDGRVIVQTFKPENNVIIRATRGQNKEFYRDELRMRELLKFPPFQRLIRLVLRGKNRAKVVEAAERLTRTFSESDLAGGPPKNGPAKSPSVELLGPVECPLPVIAGSYRYHLLIRGVPFKSVHAEVSRVVRNFKTSPGVHLEIDVDPVSTL